VQPAGDGCAGSRGGKQGGGSDFVDRVSEFEFCDTGVKAWVGKRYFSCCRRAG